MPSAMIEYPEMCGRLIKDIEDSEKGTLAFKITLALFGFIEFIISLAIWKY